MFEDIKVEIVKRRQSPNQSAINKNPWQIKFPNDISKYEYSLNGWTGNKDMKQQLKLCFASLKEAIDYAEKYHLTYIVRPEKEKKLKAKFYQDNFLD
jgi:hypothetical protein